jgi:hypothetical protein
MILELIERLTEEARRRNMDFLLIGGHAMNHLGYQRLTLDIDFMGHENTRTAWESLMTRYGYSMSVRTPAFDQYIHPAPEWPQVDVMFVNDRTWEKMRSETREKSQGRIVVSVPSPRHMVALKLHAATSPRRSEPEKDWLDIDALVRTHQLDLSDPEFKKLVLRYGGEKSLQRLKSTHG